MSGLLRLLLALVSGAPQPASGTGELQAALAAEEAGDLAGARAHLEQAVKLSPRLGLAYVELADVLLRSGEEGPALDQALSQAQQLEPENPRLFRLLGAVREAHGDAAGAMAAYERSLALRSDSGPAHFRLAGLYAAAGRAADALAQYREAARLDPADRAARLGLADQLAATGDLVGAEAELQRLVAEAPKNPLYAQRLEAVRVKLGKASPEPEPPRKKMRPLRKSKY